MTLHILWKAVSSHLFLLPTVCEQHCTYCEMQSYHIFDHDQQFVSDIAHFVEGCLIRSFLMPNSEWVTLYMVVKGSITASSAITHSKWVTLHILWKLASSHVFLSPTASKWLCTLCKRQFHHILFYDQQGVSDITHSVKCSLIICFPITNSK